MNYRRNIYEEEYLIGLNKMEEDGEKNKSLIGDLAITEINGEKA
jgi:hypothetical protein